MRKRIPRGISELMRADGIIYLKGTCQGEKIFLPLEKDFSCRRIRRVERANYAVAGRPPFY